MRPKIAKLIACAVVVASVAGVASAQLGPSPVPPHKAPAPLLAAGIPAFIALGGAGFVGRILRRRRLAAEAKAAGGGDQA